MALHLNDLCSRGAGCGQKVPGSIRRDEQWIGSGHLPRFCRHLLMSPTCFGCIQATPKHIVLPWTTHGRIMWKNIPNGQYISVSILSHTNPYRTTHLVIEDSGFHHGSWERPVSQPVYIGKDIPWFDRCSVTKQRWFQRFDGTSYPQFGGFVLDPERHLGRSASVIYFCDPL